MTFGRLLFLTGLSFALFFLCIAFAVSYFFWSAILVIDAGSVWLLYIPLIGLGISTFGLWSGLRLDSGKNQGLGGSFIIGIGLLCLATIIWVLLNGGSFGVNSVTSGTGWSVRQGLFILSTFGLACIRAGYQIVRRGPAAVAPAIALPQKSVSDDRAKVLGYGLLLSIPLVVLLVYLFLG